MKPGSHVFFVVLLALLVGSGYAAAPPDTPRILYFGHTLVSVAAVHESRISVERGFQHPRIAAIVGADIAGELAALRSIDPLHGGVAGGRRIQFLNLRTGKLERVVTDTEAAILRAGLSPDGSRAALVLWQDGKFRLDIEDLSTGRRMTTEARPSRDSTIRWSPDGSRIAFMSRDGELSIYEVASAQTQKVAQGRYPAWSPDGSRLAFANDYEIRIVDLRDLREEVYSSPLRTEICQGISMVSKFWIK